MVKNISAAKQKKCKSMQPLTKFTGFPIKEKRVLTYAVKVVSTNLVYYLAFYQNTTAF